MPRERLLTPTVLCGGPELVLCGGSDVDNVSFSQVVRLAREDGAWRELVPLSEARRLTSCLTLAPGKWLLVGGFSEREGEMLASSAVDLVDAGVGATPLPPMPFRTAEPLVAQLSDGRFLVAGGYDEAFELRTFIYSERGGWMRAADLRRPCAGAQGPFEIDARYAIWLACYASYDQSEPLGALLLDREAGTLEEVTVEVPKQCALVSLAPGRLLVSGGEAGGGQLLDTTELLELKVLS